MDVVKMEGGDVEERRKEGVMETRMTKERRPMGAMEASGSLRRSSSQPARPASAGKSARSGVRQADRDRVRKRQFISLPPSHRVTARERRAQSFGSCNVADGVPPLPKCSCPLARCPCTHYGHPYFHCPYHPYRLVLSCLSCPGSR